MYSNPFQCGVGRREAQNQPKRQQSLTDSPKWIHTICWKHIQDDIRISHLIKYHHTTANQFLSHKMKSNMQNLHDRFALFIDHSMDAFLVWPVWLHTTDFYSYTYKISYRIVFIKWVRREGASSEMSIVSRNIWHSWWCRATRRYQNQKQRW